ncbi:MAG: hypothetical protein ACFCBW_14005 [Candidatus Competibacterales bacterium]
MNGLSLSQIMQLWPVGLSVGIAAGLLAWGFKRFSAKSPLATLAGVLITISALSGLWLNRGALLGSLPGLDLRSYTVTHRFAGDGRACGAARVQREEAEKVAARRRAQLERAGIGAWLANVEVVDPDARFSTQDVFSPGQSCSATIRVRMTFLVYDEP